MTATEIQNLILIELQAEPNITDVYGLDLTKCLIKPKKERYKNAFREVPNSDDLWTVLIESKDGYRIYFDEEVNMFGLGVKSEKNEPINIGYYGTFLETLYSM